MFSLSTPGHLSLYDQSYFCYCFHFCSLSADLRLNQSGVCLCRGAAVRPLCVCAAERLLIQDLGLLLADNELLCLMPEIVYCPPT